MLVSHLYKLVFIHIPKSGGSYTIDILYKIDPNCINFDDNITYGHQTFINITKLEIYEQIKDYTFLCIIRNPIDLLISHYNYILTCKELHYLYPVIYNKNFYESVNILCQENPDLNIHYIRKSYNTDDINENIKFINFDNLEKGLKSFLINFIPDDILSNINFNIPCNVSKKFFTSNNDDTKEIFNYISIENKEMIIQNILFFKNTFNIL
jgi:hypothetical protein